MFDLIEMFNFGREIQAHGETWISVKYLQNNYHLAVKKDNTVFPCNIFLILEDKKEEVKSV